MDIIAEMPFVFLGSRLKRLAEHMQADSSLLASANNTHVPPGLYPTLAVLKKETSMTIGELARAIRVSQTAMTKSISKLVEAGLVSNRADNSDKRKSVVALTAAGASVVSRGEKIVWPLLDTVVRELTEGLSGSFPDQLAELEKRLEAEPLPERAFRLSSPELQPATEEDVTDVVSLLNRSYRCVGGEAGWTTEVGIIDGDRISEETLRQEIITKSEATLLVWKRQEKVTGCVWLEPVSDGIWYLGSLAIDPQLQNAQYGRRLMTAAEQWCRSRGGSRIQMTVLEVRDSLIKWYERRGYHQTGETEPFPSTDTRFGTPVTANLRFVFMEKSL
ncbi:bifunctional helix-turn-helix transcriptional regulator/GNAT family N-acetyltransferase [Erwinia oleae]|uniref:bifunctional helix-turn-helix transcriptional regulator/GNAT family N-acetyltransferase n=1 Tax=Erwinia oleae TaxID=796334 RepID=UPI00055693EF|nr:bifunctional helix-turn-helix transcriptional regulator/GNAT family N-acetyltransferase [Erwinia oleae]